MDVRHNVFWDDAHSDDRYADARRPRCSVCWENFDRPALVEGICNECAAQLFQRAIDQENEYPAHLSRHNVLDVDRWTGRIKPELIAAYKKIGYEYNTLPINRVYCTCERFVGGIIRDAPSNLQAIAACTSTPCAKIWCMICGTHLSATTALQHPGCTFDLHSRLVAKADALEGLERGVQYQFCPSCGRTEERFEGCNHIDCPCGESYCYVCGAQARDNSGHWDDGVNPCRLYPELETVEEYEEENLADLPLDLRFGMGQFRLAPVAAPEERAALDVDMDTDVHSPSPPSSSYVDRDRPVIPRSFSNGRINMPLRKSPESDTEHHFHEDDFSHSPLRAPTPSVPSSEEIPESEGRHLTGEEGYGPYQRGPVARLELYRAHQHRHVDSLRRRNERVHSAMRDYSRSPLRLGRLERPEHRDYGSHDRRRTRSPAGERGEEQVLRRREGFEWTIDVDGSTVEHRDRRPRTQRRRSRSLIHGDRRGEDEERRARRERLNMNRRVEDRFVEAYGLPPDRFDPQRRPLREILANHRYEQELHRRRMQPARDTPGEQDWDSFPGGRGLAPDTDRFAHLGLFPPRGERDQQRLRRRGVLGQYTPEQGPTADELEDGEAEDERADDWVSAPGAQSGGFLVHADGATPESAIFDDHGDLITLPMPNARPSTENQDADRAYQENVPPATADDAPLRTQAQIVRGGHFSTFQSPHRDGPASFPTISGAHTTPDSTEAPGLVDNESRRLPEFERYDPLHNQNYAPARPLQRYNGSQAPQLPPGNWLTSTFARISSQEPRRRLEDSVAAHHTGQYYAMPRGRFAMENVSTRQQSAIGNEDVDTSTTETRPPTVGDIFAAAFPRQAVVRPIAGIGREAEFEKIDRDEEIEAGDAGGEAGEVREE